MKTNFSKCLRFHFLVGAAFCAVASFALADEARYFRIAGPVPTTITAVGADGYVTWTNVATNATFTVQTATALLSETNWVDYVQVPVTNGVTTEQLYGPNPPSGMIFIPAGSFTIGDTLDGESDAMPTNVYVSAFYMDTNLVSYWLWTNVYHWAVANGYGFTHAGAGKAPNHPVQSVDWYDVVKWSNARSQQAGLTPVYYTDEGFTQAFTNGDFDTPMVYANWGANGYRLPTEAEWEKAARGGLSGQRFPWGNTISASQANYQGNTNSYRYDLGPNGNNPGFTNGGFPYTSPVGSFAPNGYGLYDMAGNVWEWCWDWYEAPTYSPGSPYLGGTDPHGPAEAFSSRPVVRGGRWGDYATDARCAYRKGSYPRGTPGAIFIGFRCAKGF
jgi:formylglycine-generating enzyme required for sulfatase activity